MDNVVDGNEHSKKKKEKHKPSEYSAKEPIDPYKQVVTVHKHRDPRFDNEKKSDTAFYRNYKFLDDYKVSELQALQNELQLEDKKRNKNPKKISTLKESINIYKQNIRNKQIQENEYKVIDDFKKKELQQRKLFNKKPFFLTKKSQKQLLLENKFKNFDDEDSLNKYIKKRSKKVINKERKKMKIS